MADTMEAIMRLGSKVNPQTGRGRKAMDTTIGNRNKMSRIAAALVLAATLGSVGVAHAQDLQSFGGDDASRGGYRTIVGTPHEAPPLPSTAPDFQGFGGDTASKGSYRQ
jgi:hypothetical protein